MEKKYILNSLVEFDPFKHQLKSINTPDNVQILNIPSSRCLEKLIEDRYELVMQKDFYSYVWGDAGREVSVNTLYQNIALLRKALRTVSEDLAESVITVPKMGFKLNPAITLAEVYADEEPVSTPVNIKADLPAEKTEQNVDEPTLLPHAPPASSRNPFSLSKWGLIIYTLVAFVVSFYALKLLYADKGYNELFFENHKVIAKIKSCTFYGDEINQVEDKLKLANSIVAEDCDKKPYVYITSQPFSTILSLVACDQEITRNNSPKCVVYTIHRSVNP